MKRFIKPAKINSGFINLLFMDFPKFTIDLPTVFHRYRFKVWEVLSSKKTNTQKSFVPVLEQENSALFTFLNHTVRP